MRCAALSIYGQFQERNKFWSPNGDSGCDVTFNYLAMHTFAFVKMVHRRGELITIASTDRHRVSARRR